MFSLVFVRLERFANCYRRAHPTFFMAMITEIFYGDYNRVLEVIKVYKISIWSDIELFIAEFCIACFECSTKVLFESFFGPIFVYGTIASSEYRHQV